MLPPAGRKFVRWFTSRESVRGTRARHDVVVRRANNSEKAKNLYVLKQGVADMRAEDRARHHAVDRMAHFEGVKSTAVNQFQEDLDRAAVTTAMLCPLDGNILFKAPSAVPIYLRARSREAELERSEVDEQAKQLITRHTDLSTGISDPTCVSMQEIQDDLKKDGDLLSREDLTEIRNRLKTTNYEGDAGNVDLQRFTDFAKLRSHLDIRQDLVSIRTRTDSLELAHSFVQRMRTIYPQEKLSQAELYILARHQGVQFALVKGALIGENGKTAEELLGNIHTPGLKKLEALKEQKANLQQAKDLTLDVLVNLRDETRNAIANATNDPNIMKKAQLAAYMKYNAAEEMVRKAKTVEAVKGAVEDLLRSDGLTPLAEDVLSNGTVKYFHLFGSSTNTMREGKNTARTETSPEIVPPLSEGARDQLAALSTNFDHVRAFDDTSILKRPSKILRKGAAVENLLDAMNKHSVALLDEVKECNVNLRNGYEAYAFLLFQTEHDLHVHTPDGNKDLRRITEGVANRLDKLRVEYGISEVVMMQPAVPAVAEGSVELASVPAVAQSLVPVVTLMLSVAELRASFFDSLPEAVPAVPSPISVSSIPGAPSGSIRFHFQLTSNGSPAAE